MPAKTTLPADGSIRRIASRAVVDFPHPLSPTKASVSPRFKEKDTPSTARNTCLRRVISDWEIV
jgi:hypothetical protein